MLEEAIQALMALTPGKEGTAAMKRGKLGYTCYGVDYEVCDIGRGGCGGRKRSTRGEAHPMDHEDSAAEDIREFVNRLLSKSPCREKHSSNN